MMKLKKIKESDPDPESVNERIVILKDEWTNPRTFSDHVFKLYSEHRNIRSDEDAEDPFEEDYDGVKYLKKDYVCFPVSLYDHSGYTFSIGDGSNFPDVRWDVTKNKIWLYTYKDSYESMMGPNTWKDVKKKDLLKIAEKEIHELNLSEDGCWFRWIHERKITWKKIYSNGNKEDGYDWECVPHTGDGPYLTDKLSDIHYKPENLPVYLEENAYINTKGD